MSGIGRLAQKVIDRFIDRSNVPGGVPIELYENGSEEIADDLARKGKVSLFARGRGRRKGRRDPKRIEENYLYATRRFPASVNNVIGAGALVSGAARFFQNAIGQPGTGDGFPTGYTLTNLETNMDTGGQIAQGKNFFLRSIGISFNTEALPENITQVLDSAALLFSKQGDQYQLRHGPTRLWPGGSGVTGFSATTVAATTLAAASNGVPDPRAVRGLRVPRIIREKESFSYFFDVPLVVRSTNATAFAMTDFVTTTIALWGTQLDLIPG